MPLNLIKRYTKLLAICAGVSVLVALPITLIVKNNPNSSNSYDSDVKQAKDTKEDKILQGNVNFDGTKFTINNHDSFDWTSCTMQLNGKYNYPVRSSDWHDVTVIDVISSNSEVSIGAMQLANKDGVKFDPFEVRAMDFAINCDEGFGYWKW